MLICINVALIWKHQEPAMMCMTHRRQILEQFEGEKPALDISYSSRTD